MSHSDLFWVTLTHSELLWPTLSYYDPLWVTLTHYESLWHSLRHSNPLWVTLTHYESLWPTMSHSDPFCVTLTHYESLWHTLIIIDQISTLNHIGALIKKNLLFNSSFTGWKYDRCPDIDECALGIDTCKNNSRCVNTDGSYLCQCEQGYEGDGMVECTKTYVFLY